MKFTISFLIECGETTCASKPGEFCHFLQVKLNGNCNCYLFGELREKEGWVQRHEECVKIGKKTPTHVKSHDPMSF
jgi:hypothetical protein